MRHLKLVVPTAAQCKEAWDSLKKPSTRNAAEVLVNQGYSVSSRTIARYKAAGWKEPIPRGTALRQHKTSGIVKPTQKIQALLPKSLTDQLLIDPDKNSLANVRLQRMAELYQRTLAENAATLENAAVISAILVAEEAIAALGQLIQTDPGDTARLLQAVTEASQVKRVGGEGQTPEVGDPRVIEHEPGNDMSRAIAKFRKEAGLG